MLERRNSARIVMQTKVRETNGDYMFSFDSSNLSEDGVFLINKLCAAGQEPYSQLSLTLPNGKILKGITARIVRENRKSEPKGCAYEFMNLSEEARMELKRFLNSRIAS